MLEHCAKAYDNNYQIKKYKKWFYIILITF